jgi:molecular chaperone GrpE
MHTAWPSDGSLAGEPGATTVVQVLQPGYRAGDQILRAARVAVADPE